MAIVRKGIPSYHNIVKKVHCWAPPPERSLNYDLDLSRSDQLLGDNKVDLSVEIASIKPSIQQF